MFRRLTAALLLRRLARDLARLADAHTQQTQLLARLVDRLAPQLPTDAQVDRARLRAETGLDHLDVDDAGLALDFIARTEAATGHTPDEEEILIYLADEKTVDLHQRLTAREGELQRLAESRR